MSIAPCSLLANGKNTCAPSHHSYMLPSSDGKCLSNIGNIPKMHRHWAFVDSPQHPQYCGHAISNHKNEWVSILVQNATLKIPVSLTLAPKTTVLAKIYYNSFHPITQDWNNDASLPLTLDPNQLLRFIKMHVKNLEDVYMIKIQYPISIRSYGKCSISDFLKRFTTPDNTHH